MDPSAPRAALLRRQKIKARRDARSRRRHRRRTAPDPRSWFRCSWAGAARGNAPARGPILRGGSLGRAIAAICVAWNCCAASSRCASASRIAARARAPEGMESRRQATRHCRWSHCSRTSVRSGFWPATANFTPHRRPELQQLAVHIEPVAQRQTTQFDCAVFTHPAASRRSAGPSRRPPRAASPALRQFAAGVARAPLPVTRNSASQLPPLRACSARTACCLHPAIDQSQNLAARRNLGFDRRQRIAVDSIR